MQQHTWADLKRIGSTLNDIQQTRIRTANRLGAAQALAVGQGEVLVPDESEIALDGLEAVEHKLALHLRRVYRQVAAPSVIEWQKGTIGIGEHLLARLLGEIGDPAIARPSHWHTGPAPEGHECPTNADGKMLHCKKDRHLIVDAPHARSVAQLWAYCGHGDATRRKKKGATAEDMYAAGNPRAKMLVHLIAESCMKCRRSPFRVVYDDARDLYADREGWTLGHQHAAALRLVGKEVLRDLWRSAAEAALAEAA